MIPPKDAVCPAVKRLSALPKERVMPDANGAVMLRHGFEPCFLPCGVAPGVTVVAGQDLSAPERFRLRCFALQADAVSAPWRTGYWLRV